MKPKRMLSKKLSVENYASSPGLPNRFAKITPEMVQEYKDKELIRQKPALIRQQSILLIDKMDPTHQQNLAARIMRNASISEAKTRVTIQQADRESKKSHGKLQRMNSVIGHYYEDKNVIVDNMKRRLSKIRGTVPVSPKLFTKDRAEAASRGGINLDKPVRTTHGLAYTDGGSFKGAMKHHYKWTYRDTRKSDVPLEPSIHEPDYKGRGTESPDRMKIRMRPMSSSYQVIKEVNLNSR